ncbi:MAG: 5-(carboxyamino)imidazole ribonucleotide mutase [Candidatus Eisenbacteria bacterium]|nr:5-(carboxyamino)imidazole ribonucleotide mutase [Candidatus Eisenbacteria bacterium]
MSAPRVGVIMGSRSDEAIAAAAVRVLDRLGVPSECVVASAHRDPEEVRRYAGSAERRGLEAIIAVAGLAAALPGVLASYTLLPVIGVPAPAGPLRGMDALLSMVQMPPGVPVGTVGIGEAGGKNGALLAARMLARRDPALRRRLRRYQNLIRSERDKDE